MFAKSLAASNMDLAKVKQALITMEEPSLWTMLLAIFQYITKFHFRLVRHFSRSTDLSGMERTMVSGSVSIEQTITHLSPPIFWLTLRSRTNLFLIVELEPTIRMELLREPYKLLLSGHWL
jgi:hypothetical protein